MREQRISPVREWSLSPVREYQSPVKVKTKIGKKREVKSDDQEKIKKIRTSEGVLNKYASQTDGYD